MIYCVEDDSSIRDLVSCMLGLSGFQVECFPSAQPFWEAMKKNRPELIMLDIMLPGENGLSILARLKENPDTAQIPVIMATAKGTELDKVSGLDQGADDYLVKPYSMKELVSRIKAVLRRTGQQKKESSALLSCGPISMDYSRRSAAVGEEAVSLTNKEFELLYLLLTNQGTIFSREELAKRVWSTEFIGESRTVDVHIASLRTKLKTAGELLTTVRGVGYRMEDCHGR